ncbi:hypothetical protein D3C75_639010 [compost metagenome]
MQADDKDGYTVNIYEHDKRNINLYHLTDFLAKECNVYYLTDNRDLLDSEMIKDDRSEAFYYESNKIFLKNEYAITNEKNDILEKTVDSFNKWIQIQSLKGSKRGEQDTNDIYFEIIKRINNSQPDTNKTDLQMKMNDLLHGIFEVAEKTKKYSKFGLISSFDSKKITDMIIDTKTKDRLTILISVLEPYISGLKARINALEKTYIVLEALTENLNRYFNNKTVNYSINNGFDIKGPLFESLNINMLSSGERQLLLLFLNVILSSEKASIFFIDEPEISLNVKWQRMFLRSLLQLNLNGNVQYIIASHSMEILAPNKDSVIKLISAIGEKNGTYKY